jgi:hypothetical protein
MKKPRPVIEYTRYRYDRAAGGGSFFVGIAYWVAPDGTRWPACAARHGRTRSECRAAVREELAWMQARRGARAA